MDKLAKVSNVTAALIIFLAWYVSATITTLIMAGLLNQMIGAFAWIALVVLAFMTVMFIISWRIRRTDFVDVAWSISFVVAAITSLLLNRYELQFGLNAQTLVTLLVVIWAARLAFLTASRIRRQPEDKRYVELRRRWQGNRALNTYLRIFVIQGILATIISIAVIHINLSLPTTLNTFAYVGLAIWAIGFYFETVSDYQLRTFNNDPKRRGTLMTEGLWKFSRHPNFFGEAVMWLGVAIIALGTPYGWIGVITPVIITYLLLYVSGVPTVERSLSKKPGWEDYKNRTSRMLPLPPNQD